MRQPILSEMRNTIAAKLKRCSACEVTYYCNQDCQRADWERHKGPCASLSGTTCVLDAQEHYVNLLVELMQYCTPMSDEEWETALEKHTSPGSPRTFPRARDSRGEALNDTFTERGSRGGSGRNGEDNREERGRTQEAAMLAARPYIIPPLRFRSPDSLEREE